MASCTKNIMYCKKYRINLVFLVSKSQPKKCLIVNVLTHLKMYQDLKIDVFLHVFPDMFMLCHHLIFCKLYKLWDG
jgi:hypothetical protein